MANFSPLSGNNDKKQKLIDDLTKISTLTDDVINNPDTPIHFKLLIQQLSTLLAATAEQLQQQQLAMDPHEMERQRSVVLIGLPESTKAKATERAADDEQTVRNVLDELDVECLPQAVYRLGKPDPAKKGSIFKILNFFKCKLYC